MARRRGDWVAFSKRLVAALEASPDERPEITLTIDEIKAESGTTMTLESLSDRGLWKACREGRRYFDTHTKAGLSLEEHVAPSGKVVAVTYRLAQAPVLS